MSETSRGPSVGLVLGVAASGAFCLIGIGALGVAFWMRPAPAPAPSSGQQGGGTTTVVETPPPPPSPAPPPEPPPTPHASASAQGRSFREALGLFLDDPPLLESPVVVGGGSVGVMERVPKITAVTGDTVMAKANVKTGERVYSVDGRPVEKAHEVFEALARKTVPGYVRLKVGVTKWEARDLVLEVTR